MIADGEPGDSEDVGPTPSDAERRDQTGEERDIAAERRDQTGEQRDVAAERRDQAGEERDESADRRDRAAEQRDRDAEGGAAAPWPESPASSEAAREHAAADRRGAQEDRRAGADDRGRAVGDRGAALIDREAGAGARREAELDRDAAFDDRGRAAEEHQHASLDGLTGAYVRGAGVLELGREIARALRTELPLALAFIDVDDLKALNDEHGHAAGDRMLHEVADVLRLELRPYDLIIRYGGDEFVCALAGVNLGEATTRFSHAQAALANAPGSGSISIGLAELRPDDTPDDLVARADAALYEARRRRRGGRA